MLIIFIVTAILLSIAVAAACLFLNLMKMSIMFSKVSFALFCAIPMCSSLSLVDGGFLNYLLCAGIAFGILCLFSLLPRMNAALKFFCTLFISIFVMLCVLLIGGGIFLAGPDGVFQLHIVVEFLVKGIGLLLAAGAWKEALEQGSCLESPNVVIVTIEKIFSSFLYGVGALFVAMPLNASYPFPDWLMLVVFVAALVATFIGDKFLIGER